MKPQNLKPAQQLAQVLVSDIATVEHSMNQASYDLATLLQTCLMGPFQASISPTVGRKAMREIHAAITASGQARDHLLAAHRSLAIEAQRMGIPYTAGPLEKPDGDDTPENPYPKGVLVGRD